MPAPLEISALSKEYIKVRIQAKVSGATYDPTLDPVSMAFTLGGTAPTGPDWKTGSWETDTSTQPVTYWARCLVGPGGAITFAAGLYTIWVQISDSPEVPIRNVGLLRVV